MTTYLFLDTNVYMSFKPIDQWDMKPFGGKCTLVLPEVVLQELDKHKDKHHNPKTRERVRKICQRIHESFDNDGQISEDITLDYYDIKPDLGKYGFEDTPDNRILSCLLDYSADHENKLLISNDSNLQLKAKKRKVVIWELPEEYKLPVDEDSVLRENKKLKQELDRLQNARPRLEIGLVPDKSQGVEANPVFPLRSNKTELTDEEINRQVEKIRCSLSEKYFSLPNQLTSAAFLPSMISPDEISKYHQQLDKYPEVYRKYLLNRRKFLLQPKYRFTIGIANVGTAPAQNVDIYLHFPNGFELYDEKSIPSGPQEPSLPQKPLSVIERMSQNGTLGLQDFRYTVPNIGLPSSFSLKRTNSYDVSDSFRVIKHNERGCLRELFLWFDSIDMAKSFRCEYRVTVDNLPEEIKGNINFQFQADVERDA